MILHDVKVHPSKENLGREDQLAWKIAEVAADPVAVDRDVTDMVINRIIDNAAVAIASLNRGPDRPARGRRSATAPRTARRSSGFAGERVSPEWAAWANGVAVRELDYHDTFLAAEYSHPGDNIPPILAVAQHVGASGRGPGPRHRHRLRDPGRPGQGHLPAQAQDRPRRPPRPLRRRRHRHPARPRRRDDLPGRRPGAAHHHRHPAVPQGRDLHLEGARPGVRRQDGRRGGRPRDARRDLAVPIYEGEDGVIAWMLDGPDASYNVPLPDGRRGQARHPRHLHQGALGRVPGAGVDRPRPQAARRTPGSTRPGQRRSSVLITTSHHTHYVIGSGANDPQKYDPTASRETLDHSIPYIFTVALQDGAWHHVDSYAPGRAGRADTVRCGTRSPRARTRSGPAATTRSTWPRRRSAAASRS